MFLNRKALKKINSYNSDTINNILKFSEKLIDTSISKLIQIKDIEELEISEKEKDIHRNVIISTSINELNAYQEKIKSILNTTKSI